MHATRLLFQFGALASAIALAPMAHAVDWPQFGFDAAHSGTNPTETAITSTNVAQWVSLLPGGALLPAVVDSAPVYASDVTTPGGVKNLLFALGSDHLYDGSSSMGTLMAVDAATGNVVWSKSNSGSSQHASSSPAIDPDRHYVYSFGLDGYVHKYQIGDGSEIVSPGPAGWPAPITLKPGDEKVASGLTIASVAGTDYLEVVTDGYNGDGGDYQGHLVSINLGSGARTVFNFMCSNVATLLAHGGCPTGRMSGAWGRGGATFDAATGRIYATSGNGIFDAGSGGTNWGDSVLALAPDGRGQSPGIPRDSYTPSNFTALYNSDTDLGSVSLAVLPAPAGSVVAHIGMQVGKDAVLHLINLDDMSGAHGPAHAGGELQLLNVPQGGVGMREQPAVWVNPADHSTWLFVGNSQGISGLQLELDASHKPLLVARWTKSGGSTSAIVANGVVYNAGACTGGGTCISARDPLSGDVLGSSPDVGGLHWQSPILVDGMIYITDNNAKLWKFGLDSIFKNGFDG